MADAPLHFTYRPVKWDEVIGQDAAVKSLSGVIKRKESQAFLLTGPSGVGKTTLARIGAYEFGADVNTIREIPAAIYTGVDAMRGLLDGLQYVPLSGGGATALIVDEAHRLSGAAWDAILKAVEEPPLHVAWFFCTTEPGKVPKTIKTRCTSIVLRELTEKELGQIYDDVADAEKLDVPGDVADLMIREARGSARQLLVNMASARDAKSKKEAAEILQTVIDTDATLELCRYLAQGKGSWPKVMGLLDQLVDENAESVRIIVTNYMASAARKSKTERDACFFLNIMEHFATSYNPSERQAPLLRSIGRVLYGG